MRKELKEYYLKKACSEDDKKLIRNFEEILSKLLIIDENLRVDFIEIFQEINKIVSKEELFGNLSEEIRQQSGLKNPIHQKNALSICKSQEFLPKGNNSYKCPSEIMSFHSKNSMPIDGCCEIVLPTGDRYFGQFSNFKKQGKGVLRMKSGDFYKGDFEFDEMEGYGEYYYENNDKYVGEFKKGQRHGKGLFKFKNVGFYDGNWEDGFQEGHGEFNWDNGDKYKGLFEKGKMHGKGIYEYIDGKKYKGEWKNDQKEGHGVIHLKNGDRYTGEFKNDVYDGKGVYFFQNGEKKGGIWKRGNLLEKKEDCQIF